MDAFQEIDTAFIFIALGAFFGSLKASVELNKGKHLCARVVDVPLGVYVGVSVAFHLGSADSLWLGGMLAVVGGACGAMVVEVIMSLTPSLVKKFMQNWTNGAK